MCSIQGCGAGGHLVNPGENYDQFIDEMRGGGGRIMVHLGETLSSILLSTSVKGGHFMAQLYGLSGLNFLHCSISGYSVEGDLRFGLRVKHLRRFGDNNQQFSSDSIFYYF